MERMLTVPEVAQMKDIAETTVRKLARSGTWQGAKRIIVNSHTQWLIPESSLEGWERSNVGAPRKTPYRHAVE